MTKFLVSLSLIVFASSSFSQIVYQEDFNGATTTWLLNSITGPEGTFPNFWYISCQEEGVGAGSCGAACGAGDKTLHISANASTGGDVGAAYAELSGGITTTNRRSTSPNINTTGFSGLTLSFDMISYSGGATNFSDFTTVQYSTNSGATWTPLPSALVSQCCDGFGNPITCTGTDQGLWQTVNVSLPAACDNITTLQIGFFWQNLDDGIATDPSFAVDNIVIAQGVTAPPPVASFTPSATTICVGDCITFTENSTSSAAGGITNWAWTFASGTPANFIGQNPGSVCWNTPGTYAITLGVTDANGIDDTTINITVNACTGPTAIINASSTSICAGDSINFTDGSLGSGLSAWNWTFNGGTPATSAAQNPGYVTFATPGSYNITLQVTDANGTDDTTISITVTNCNVPHASFIPSQTTICEGDCITFTDNSTGTGISAWSWTFNGGTPGTSNSQNPGSVCFATTGTFNITLSITDANGTDDTTIAVNVITCTPPVANYSHDYLACQGQCANFTDLSTGGVTGWQWSFGGGTPATSTAQNPQNICFNSPGTYDITLIVSNSSGTDTLTTTVTINPLPVVLINSSDITIDFGQDTTITAVATPGTSISWSPIIGLTCGNCPTTVASPINTTTYLVTATDANGCAAFDQITIYVNLLEGVGVPNAFSPNGDGENDILYVKGDAIEKIHFIVYNRYGQQVFESHDRAIGWDGKFNGKEINPGTFAYVLEYNFYGRESAVLKGSVTLIK